MCPILNSLQLMANFMVVHWLGDVRDDRRDALGLIDPAPYDQILNLDCDILAMQDINPLFSARDELVYYEEPWHYIQQNPNDVLTCWLMTPQERLIFGDCHPINAGQFLVSSSQARNLQDIWTRIQGMTDRYGIDQCALNTLVRRQLLPARPFHPYEVANAQMIPRVYWGSYRLIHFAGDGCRVGTMREISDARR
jgi:hypothetical protein